MHGLWQLRGDQQHAEVRDLCRRQRRRNGTTRAISSCVRRTPYVIRGRIHRVSPE
jgi:hypothetical protein